MNLSALFPLILSFAMVAVIPVRAQVSEMERLSGFAEHHKNNEKFDKARQQGMFSQFEEEDQWELQKNRDLAEFKRTKKPDRVDEEGADARADAADKKAYRKVQEQNLQAYSDLKKKQQTLVREKFGLPSETQELGLDETRPRYDYRKRAAFGATPKYGKNASSSSGSGGSSGGRYNGGHGGGNSGSGSSFPPPPAFDDFGGEGNYVPAPSVGQMDDFGDLPPPPPPPPSMPYSEDGGGFGATPNYDFPPPPPPPPFGGDDSGDF